MVKLSLTSANFPKPLAYEDYEYEIHILDNGLKVLLVSSGDIDKAACCIGVNIGSMQDPRDYLGLAHFCEHMLFMGNAKYQDETEYNRYIQKNGGDTNAFTSENETVYYGTVQPTALEGLVDRTLEFFVSPSFNESAVDREIEAVNSEFEKGLQEDARRKNQVWKLLANAESAYAKFNVGNNAHLRRLDLFDGDREASLSALRNELIKFHTRYYSANQMSAVIMGRDTLEQLRGMVLPRFERLINKDVHLPRGSEVGREHPPFCRKNLQQVIHIVPVREMDRSIAFYFVIQDQYDVWREKPTSYIGHVLGHEGPHSLLSVLKSRGLATGLSAGVRGQNIGQSFFVISVEATAEGLTLDGVKEVGLLVFIAIRQLLDAGVTEASVEEERRIEEMRWKYHPMTAVHEFAIQGVINMLNYPPELVFRGPCVPLEIDLPLICATLQRMISIENLNILVTGKCFEEQCKQIEPIYGTHFSVAPFPSEWMDLWTSVKEMSAEDFQSLTLSKHINLPKPNLYIAENLAMKEMAGEEQDFPQRLELKLPGVEFFLEQKTSFKIPEVIFVADLYLPLMTPKKDDVLQCTERSAVVEKQSFGQLPWMTRLALLSIYQTAVVESLNETTYDAQVAGLSFGLRLTRGPGKGIPAFSIAVDGFNDKADTLLRTILNRLRTFDVLTGHIELAVKILVRAYSNRLISTPPYQLVQLRICQLLCPTMWDDREMLRCLQDLSASSVERTLRDTSGKLNLTELFQGSTMQGLVSGNLTEDEAKRNFLAPELWEGMVQPPQHQAERLPDGQIDLAVLSKETLIGDDVNFVAKGMDREHSLTALVMQEVTYNKEDPNGAVQLVLQASGSDVADVAFQNILSVWLSDKFFDELRTRQTLGYVVGLTLQEQTNRLLRGFLVQSTKPASLVINAIIAFLKEWFFDEHGNIVPKLSDVELAEFRTALIAKLSEKPKKLSEVHNRSYGEIKTARYDFARRQKQIDYIRTYTLQQLTQDLRKLLTSRPWLIVALQPSDVESTGEINKIDDTELLPIDLFYLQDRNSIIRHVLNHHDDSAFIPMPRWGYS